jgi:hypothetical protein
MYVSDLHPAVCAGFAVVFCLGAWCFALIGGSLVKTAGWQRGPSRWTSATMGTVALVFALAFGGLACAYVEAALAPFTDPR